MGLALSALALPVGYMIWLGYECIKNGQVPTTNFNESRLRTRITRNITPNGPQTNLEGYID